MEIRTLVSMPTRIKGANAAIIAFCVWLAETAYFGWHVAAQSRIESLWDFVCGCVFCWGIGYDRAMWIYEEKLHEVLGKKES